MDVTGVSEENIYLSQVDDLQDQVDLAKKKFDTMINLLECDQQMLHERNL
jgi:hypothetical protein